MAGDQLSDPCFEDEWSLLRDTGSLIRAQNSLLFRISGLLKGRDRLARHYLHHH